MRTQLRVKSPCFRPSYSDRVAVSSLAPNANPAQKGSIDSGRVLQIPPKEKPPSTSRTRFGRGWRARCGAIIRVETSMAMFDCSSRRSSRPVVGRSYYAKLPAGRKRSTHTIARARSVVSTRLARGLRTMILIVGCSNPSRRLKPNIQEFNAQSRI